MSTSLADSPAPAAVQPKRTFPPFDLKRLLDTVFDPREGERVCILIDLQDPREMKDFAFLQDPKLTIQRHAYEKFFQGLKNGVLAALKLRGGDMFAYKATGGSNLDLPEDAYDKDGNKLRLLEDVCCQHDLILCISTSSATAPLTAWAKKYGFRGATMHGMNDIILATGLAVDYFEVSKEAEKLRLALTKADWVEIDYAIEGKRYTLHLDLGRQEAQKSHGLCRSGEPDVANLPAGEVYFVPDGAEGQFPMRYEDGTIGLMEVTGGRVVKATLIRGSEATIAEHNQKLVSDPVTGELGELGFGTQDLPVSGRDIQDEKVLGTFHVATGRSDHLGGKLTPDRFTDKSHATHDDILFSPSKTPEIAVPEVRMLRDGATQILLRHYELAPYLRAIVDA